MKMNADFPVKPDSYVQDTVRRDSGIDIALLDQFAMAALQGIITSTRNCSPEVCARMAYEHAIAMLDVRGSVLDYLDGARTTN